MNQEFFCLDVIQKKEERTFPDNQYFNPEKNPTQQGTEEAGATFFKCVFGAVIEDMTEFKDQLSP